MSRLIKQIPDEWKARNFDEVFEFLPTLTLSRKDLNSDSEFDGIYNIHYGDIHSTYKFVELDFDKEKSIPKIIDDKIDESKLTFLTTGDLVIADASEDYEGVAACVELSNVKDRKVTAGLHTYAVRDKKGYSSEGFRAYILKHPWVNNEVNKIATGSKVYGISKTNISKLKVILPPLPEQQKIASILSKWDELIETQTQLIEEKEKQKKGLMQKLLTGEVRFPGFEEEWEEKTIAEFGLVQTGNTPSRKELSYWGGDFNWTTADDMDNKYVVSSLQKLTKRGFEKARVAKKGSVLVTCIASIGKNAISKVDTGFNQQINSITVNEDFSSEFIYYLIDSQPNKLLEFAGAGAMPMLNKSNFMKIKYLVPNLKEQ